MGKDEPMTLFYRLNAAFETIDDMDREGTAILGFYGQTVALSDSRSGRSRHETTRPGIPARRSAA